VKIALLLAEWFSISEEVLCSTGIVNLNKRMGLLTKKQANIKYGFEERRVFLQILKSDQNNHSVTNLETELASVL
jgi:hypothetical protein